MANTSCPFIHWWWPCTCRKSPAIVKRFIVSLVEWKLQFGLVRLRINPRRCEAWCQLDEVTREKLSNTWQRSDRTSVGRFCDRHGYPDKSAKDNTANDTSAKPTVRMPTVRKGQPCECQQCECDSGANVSSANATAVRKTILRTVQKLSVFFFFAKTFATFYLNFWPKNAHNSAVQHLPRNVKVGIYSFLCGETFHTKKTAKNCLIKIC